MSAAVISFRANILPWAVSPEDEARFRRILNIVLAVCVLLCILLLLLIFIIFMAGLFLCLTGCAVVLARKVVFQLTNLRQQGGNQFRLLLNTLACFHRFARI